MNTNRKRIFYFPNFILNLFSSIFTKPQNHVNSKMKKNLRSFGNIVPMLTNIH